MNAPREKMTPADIEAVIEGYGFYCVKHDDLDCPAARQKLGEAMSAIRSLCAERDALAQKLEQSELRYADLSSDYYDKSVVKRVVTDADQRAAMETIHRLSSERDALQARVEELEAKELDFVCEHGMRVDFSCRDCELLAARAHAAEFLKQRNDALRELAETRREWRPIETAPYATWVLAWLHLPKNPIASAPVVAQRCHVERDDPESYSLDIRQTVGCWWANGRYYPVGHVTHWMPLPAAPKETQDCDHHWIDMTNQVVQSGWWCRKCNAVTGEKP